MIAVELDIDDRPEKAGRNQGRDGRGRFRPGHSGNRRGKPSGTRHKATLAAEALLDGHAEALTSRAIELALAGDLVALKLCLDRIIAPRRDRPSKTIDVADAQANDLPDLSKTVLQEAMAGGITPKEAADLARVIEVHGVAIELADQAARIDRLEAARARAS